MDKRKLQKQKERERRVAKEKLAEAEKRRAIAKTDQEAAGTTPEKRAARTFAAAIPKIDNKLAGGGRPQVTHRRAGS